MIVRKAITIRVKPNKEQRDRLDRHFGANRWLWNHFLEKRMAEYAASGVTSSYYRDTGELTKLKRQPGNEWLYEVSVNSQQNTLRNLDAAYKRFFRKQNRFPKFKRKKHDQSFGMSGEIKIRENRVCFPRFPEGIGFKRSLPEFSRIVAITLKKTSSGHFYAVLTVEAEATPLPMNESAVGIDLGLTDLLVLSDGSRVASPKLLKRRQKSLASAQKHLSRKMKGSKRREAQRLKVAGIHEQIANARKDFLHKVSHDVTNKFGIIAVESLAVRNLVKNRCLAKAISDASWSELARYLEYKAAWRGRTLIRVGRFFPSSKACSDCGSLNRGLKLNDRVWTCDGCGARHDRDLNAARNILREGLNINSGRQSPNTVVEAA